jgi:hypothetical protein
MEDLLKLPNGLCDGMSRRALQVSPAPGFDIGFALHYGGIWTPLCEERYKSLATYLAAPEQRAVHRIADWVCKYHSIARAVTGVIFI